MDTREAEARVGQTIDRYRLEGVLGAGGFGAVFRARHLGLDRPVALKLLHGALGARGEMQERFLREARTLARLGHPNVVAVHDSGVTPSGEAFLAMELLEGEDLGTRLTRLQFLRPEEALAIADAILDGLASAHDAGIVHRDLKPANVFLARTPMGEIPKLVDFGISKVEDDRMTRTGTVLGTPVYMAPEAFLKGTAFVDARADLYAVGVMLYEMLSGRLPYEAPSYEALVLKVATEPPPRFATVAPQAPQALAWLIDRAMARRPEDRFPDARAMKGAIAEARSAGLAPIASAKDPQARPVPRAARSGARAFALAFGIAFALSGLAAFGLAVYRVVSRRSHRAPIATSTVPSSPLSPSLGVLPDKESAEAARAEVASSPLVPPKPDATGAERPADVANARAPIEAESEAPEPGGAAGPSSAGRGPVRGIRMHEPNVVGEAPVEAIHARFAESRGAMERCRTDRDEHVSVQLHVHGGRITLAAPYAGRPSSDVDVARCVANVMRSGGPLPSGQGIILLEFELGAR